MKKLLNTLYVLTEENYLTLDGENIVIFNGKQQVGRFPLHTFENIISFTYAGATPSLMGACAERGIGLHFFSTRGHYLASITSKSYGNVLLRKEQFRISDDQNASCRYAKNMILGKVFNCRWSLERTVRDHELRVNEQKIRSVSADLKAGLERITKVDNLEELRGVEGELATRYFSAFDELIINQKEEFPFQGRNRRPPKDRVNATLSFVYTILGGECANALESVGLDPYVGFLHRDRPGRQSLALDLLEELRGAVADRFVLTMINKKIIRTEHFEQQEDGAVFLNENGRKVLLQAWQTRKKDMITHPYLKEKLEWGLVPYVQALLLARTIRGDMEEYPCFFWK